MDKKGWLERKIVNKENGRQILEMGGSVNFAIIDLSKMTLLGTQQRAVHKSKGIFGGYIDDGENPIDALYRELKEETNIDKKDVIGVSRIYENKLLSEGYTTETNSLYIVYVRCLCELDLNCNDENEDIELCIEPLSDIKPHNCNGVKAFIALDYLQKIEEKGKIADRIVQVLSELRGEKSVM